MKTFERIVDESGYFYNDVIGQKSKEKALLELHKRFKRTKDDTIIDCITNLEWDFNKFEGIWQECINHAKSLGNGWRLPTVSELFFISGGEGGCSRLNYIELFSLLNLFYWTSTTYVNKEEAQVVSLTGSIFSFDKNTTTPAYFVRDFN